MRLLVVHIFCLAAVLPGKFSGGLPVLCAAERPNVVVVFADDWGHFASAYGRLRPGTINDVVRTPNFDRLAQSGVLFTNAFVNAPSCTPCRSSLLSGQYFWRTGRGAILQGAVWDEKIPSFPLLLENTGYRLGSNGKVWSPGSPANAPIGARRTAVNSAGGRFNDFSEELAKSSDPEATKAHLLAEVQLNFRSFLLAGSTEQPFLYWWGPTNTHRTWVQGSGKKFWNINPDDLRGKLPGHLPDVAEVREDVADYLGEVQALDAGLGALLQVLSETRLSRNTLVVVSGDHGMPGVPGGKCNLYDLGTHVSLAVAFPGRIPGGRVVEDFVSLPDLAPTILEAGGAGVPEVMTGRSLWPLLQQTSGGQVDETRRSVLIGRERHVARARPDLLPCPQRAIRTPDYLYIRNFAPERWPMGTAPGFGQPEGPMPSTELLSTSTYAAFADMDASPTKAWVIEQGMVDSKWRPFLDRAFALRPGEELYDLKTDPEQLRNVAAEPQFAAVREELANRLLTALRESGDPRVTAEPGSVVFDQPPYTDDVENTGKAGPKKKAGKSAAR
jgi:N-sulfoglucosamine sulfohydrolase